jgi:hypothetical protein
MFTNSNIVIAEPHHIVSTFLGHKLNKKRRYVDFFRMHNSIGKIVYYPERIEPHQPLRRMREV